MTKPVIQLVLEMRCCESLLRGGVRIGSTDNHPFILDQLQRANGLLTEFDAIPHTDRYWADEMIADETYYALEQAVTEARDYLRSTFKQVEA